MCSSCAKKAALRNSRVVNRSKKVSKKLQQKLEEKNNENTETQNDGESEIS